MIYVNVKPDGEILFETGTVEQAVEMIRLMRIENDRKAESENGSVPPVETKPKRKPKHKAKQDEFFGQDEKPSLTPQLQETLDWLREGNEVGHSSHDIAVGMDIKMHAAYYRVQQLVRKGYLRQDEDKFYYVIEGD